MTPTSADQACPPSAGTVRFGTTTAEQHWRPSDLASLPALRDPAAERALLGMDEILVAASSARDVVITRREPPAAFDEVMRAAGFGAVRQVAPGDTEDSVESRLARSALSFQGMNAGPFAVVPGTSDVADRLGLVTRLPTVPIVAEVNSKAWSTRLGLNGAGELVCSLEELRRVATVPCVIKDLYGVAGQGNIVIDSAARLTMVERMLERSTGRVELIVQPLFERAYDFAAHVDISVTGAVTWLGVQQLDNAGHSYRGSLPASARLQRALDDAGYREIVDGVSAAVARTGYHGPLGIDSLITCAGELVPVLEVNARMSPGHIAARMGVPLRMRSVAVGDATYYERLVQALADRDLLAVDGREGILPLTATTLTPPRGWLFYAVFGSAEPDITDVLDQLI